MVGGADRVDLAGSQCAGAVAACSVTGELFAVALSVTARVAAARVTTRSMRTGDSPPTRRSPSTRGTRAAAVGLVVRLVVVGLVGLVGAAGEDASDAWGALYLTGALGPRSGRRRGVHRDAGP